MRGVPDRPPRARRRPALRLKDTDYECTCAEYAETVRAAPRPSPRSASAAATPSASCSSTARRCTSSTCAAMHLGATCFSIYNTSSPEQIEYLVADAAQQRGRHRAAVPRPRARGARAGRHARARRRDRRRGARGRDVARASSRRSATDDFDFDAAWRAVEPDDVLCLIYTSGTTGPPKGVQLTHANMMAEWRALDPVDADHARRALDLLPPDRARRRPLGAALLAAWSTATPSTAVPTRARWWPTRWR